MGVTRMEGRVLGSVLSALVAVATPAAAEERVNTLADDRGVTVHVVSQSTGAAGSTGSRTRTSTFSSRPSGCRRSYVPADSPSYLHSGAVYAAPGWSEPAGPMPPAPSPVHRPYHVFCRDRYITSVWIAPPDALGATTAGVVRELLARIEFPRVDIHVSPVPGLTGMASWFWLDGYTESPIGESRSALGISIDLELRAVGLSWDFGDGTTVVAGPGSAPPEPSSVQHVYERKGIYTVAVGFGWQVRYRVNGGAWTELDVVSRRVTRAYQVREIRSLLTG